MSKTIYVPDILCLWLLEECPNYKIEDWLIEQGMDNLTDMIRSGSKFDPTTWKAMRIEETPHTLCWINGSPLRVECLCQVLSKMENCDINCFWDGQIVADQKYNLDFGTFNNALIRTRNYSFGA